MLYQEFEATNTVVFGKLGSMKLNDNKTQQTSQIYTQKLLEKEQLKAKMKNQSSKLL